MTPKPAPFDDGIVFAFRALFEGKASDVQQKRAMEWLVLNACHVGQSSFGETDRHSAFLEGERHIGLQIARMSEPDALKKPAKAKAAKVATEANRGDK